MSRNRKSTRVDAPSAETCIRYVVVGIFLALAYLPIPAQAALTGYTDAAAFTADLPGAPTTLDFDSLAGGNSSAFGTTIGNGDTVGGITFTYPTLAGFGVTLEVRNDYDTTSPENALGTDDGGVLQGGDALTLSFAPVNALGLFFTTAPDPLFDDDIVLSAAGGSVGLVATDLQQTLPDGGLVYFLGLIDNAVPFTSAAISGSGPYFAYTIDDITTASANVAVVVPEPGSLTLLLTFGLIGLAVCLRKKPALSVGLLALILAAPAQAQRTSLESLAADHDDIQDVQNTGATPIFACGRIDTPGSYVVVQNLDAVGDCLVITASNVTLDLGGHVLRGVGTGSGVLAEGSFGQRSSIVVRNGIVREFLEGVALRNADEAVVRNVSAITNRTYGIRVGRGSTVAGSKAIFNDNDGINTDFLATITGNTTMNNRGAGIDAGLGSTLINNGVTFNSEAGIRVDDGSTVMGNTAFQNDEGLIVGKGSTVSGNTASGSGSGGISVGLGSTVSGNTAFRNGDTGIEVVCPSNVIGNTATGNFVNLILSGGGCNDDQNVAPPPPP